MINSCLERIFIFFDNIIRWFQRWKLPHGNRGGKGTGGWDSKGYTRSLLLLDMTPHWSRLLHDMTPHCPRLSRNVSPHWLVALRSVSPHSSVVVDLSPYVVDLSPHKWPLTRPVLLLPHKWSLNQPVFPLLYCLPWLLPSCMTHCLLLRTPCPITLSLPRYCCQLLPSCMTRCLLLRTPRPITLSMPQCSSLFSPILPILTSP